jgi:hypothetical protein
LSLDKKKGNAKGISWFKEFTKDRPVELYPNEKI